MNNVNTDILTSEFILLKPHSAPLNFGRQIMCLKMESNNSVPAQSSTVVPDSEGKQVKVLEAEGKNKTKSSYRPWNQSCWGSQVSTAAPPHSSSNLVDSAGVCPYYPSESSEARRAAFGLMRFGQIQEDKLPRTIW